MASDDKLKLETNVPATIALEFEKGLPVSGQYGDQVLFTLTDGRKWYCAPFVAAKIEAAGIPRGVFFTICKREVSEGNRRRVEYQIGDAVPQKQTAAVVQTAAGTSRESRNPPFNAVSNNNSTTQSHVNHSSSNNQTPAAPVAVSAPPAAAALDSSVVALLKMAGCGAIDAVLAIEQYAADRGLTDFAFGVENIQKFAACLFIELNKKAGRA